MTQVMRTAQWEKEPWCPIGHPNTQLEADAAAVKIARRGADLWPLLTLGRGAAVFMYADHGCDQQRKETTKTGTSIP